MKAGMQIGQFVLDKRLGQGGMAEVWLGHNAVLGTPVAVKYLVAPWAGHPELEQRFLKEAQRQGALDHPNIVKVYGFEYVEGHSFLVMQYIDGESLDDRLARFERKPLDYGDILRIASGALHGLEHAHNHHIVHRDIKPSNIMIDRNLHAYVADFGLVMVRDEQRVTRTGTTMGTPLYMSPEQILRPKEVDHRSDIYSFGCVLYEMCTGRTPFESEQDDTDFNVKMAHTTQTPPSIAHFNPTVPPELEAVIMKCLAKSPNERFSTCGELREALALSMSNLGGGPGAGRQTPLPLPNPMPLPYIPPPPTPAPVPSRRIPFSPPALIAISALLVASLGGGTYYVVTHLPSDDHKNVIVKKKATNSGRDNKNQDPQNADNGQDGAGKDAEKKKAEDQEKQRQQQEQQEAERRRAEQQKQEDEQRRHQQESALAAPLHNARFRVRLNSPVSSEASEQGQAIRATVISPPAYSGSTMEGIVKKAGRTGFIPGHRKAELLFTFHTLHPHGGDPRAIESRIVSFTNSRGQKGTDEEGEGVDKKDGAKKDFIVGMATTATGAIVGGIKGHKGGAIKGAAAGAAVGIVLTGFTGKGSVMSFAPGSVFDLQVSDRKH